MIIDLREAEITHEEDDHEANESIGERGDSFRAHIEKQKPENCYKLVTVEDQVCKAHAQVLVVDDAYAVVDYMQLYF